MDGTATDAGLAGRRDLRRAWRGVLAGLCASLVAIGLARFAYTPLIPALIGAGWLSVSGAYYLGAANLAGYLAGALLARPAAAWLGPRAAVRATMLLACVSFFACSWRLGLFWLLPWRIVSGVAGGIVMVLAAPMVLPAVPPAHRGLAGGLIFTGVGLGIAASGTIVPGLLGHGLAATWDALGAAALALTALAWGFWPATAIAPAVRPPRRRDVDRLCLAYALCASGLVPHMIFFADHVARVLGQGVAAGSLAWVLFGAGAAAGPLTAGWLADRLGTGRALLLVLAAQTAADALTAAVGWGVAMGTAAIVVGACVPGVTALVLGRVREMVPPDEATGAWSRATVAFAIGQAAAGYGLAALRGAGAPGWSVFAVGAAALAGALVLVRTRD
jgi:predicted MFS family arabinose efflux permease